jgi:hypothetical protein
MDEEASAQIIMYALFSRAGETIPYFYSTHEERYTF